MKVPSISTGELKRVLTYWDVAALAVGIIIGSGIFAVPPSIARSLDSFGSMISVWVLGGVLALCGALCYAELSAMFPRAGGAFVFLKETYGPAVSFVYGWSALLITYPASIAAIAMVFASYFSRLVPMSAGAQVILAAVLCLVFAREHTRHQSGRRRAAHAHNRQGGGSGTPSDRRLPSGAG